MVQVMNYTLHASHYSGLSVICYEVWGSELFPCLQYSRWERCTAYFRQHTYGLPAQLTNYCRNETSKLMCRFNKPWQGWPIHTLTRQGLFISLSMRSAKCLMGKCIRSCTRDLESAPYWQAYSDVIFRTIIISDSKMILSSNLSKNINIFKKLTVMSAQRNK
jgi:hypothetical protein